MGITLSKTPQERRNTILRRSQRKSILDTQSKTEKIKRDIRRFKGDSEEDQGYKAIREKIDECKKELFRNSKNLQPQIRNIHVVTQQKVDQLEALLQDKLKENAEKAEKQRLAEEEEKKIEGDEDGDDTTNNNVDDRSAEELETQRDGMGSPLSDATIGIESELNSLISSPSKRKTVELNFISIEPLTTVEKLEMSPQEKRKSILKYGVQVLPTLNNELKKKCSISSPRDSRAASVVEADNDSNKTLLTIEEIQQQVSDIELEISQFIGKKDGKKYTEIKEKLFKNLDNLQQLPNRDVDFERVKRYIYSSLDFLDSKASASDDDVFLPEGSKPEDFEPNGSIPGSIPSSPTNRNSLYKVTSI